VKEIIQDTHTLLYLGRNEKGELIFASQTKFSTGIRTLADLTNRGVEARDIMVPKGSVERVVDQEE
jgi:hypothetical protein